MNDSFASWMIAGGPRIDEHDQRTVSHLVAIREMRESASAAQPGLVARIRSRFAAPQATADSLDCCPA